MESHAEPCGDRAPRRLGKGHDLRLPLDGPGEIYAKPIHVSRSKLRDTWIGPRGRKSAGPSWSRRMIPAWSLFVLIFGVNFTLWGAVGVLRFLDAGLDRFRTWPRNVGSATHLARRSTALTLSAATDYLAGAALAAGGDRRLLTVADVAVLMAAHNEEVVIDDSLAAITSLVPPENVHVVSDASTDGTVELACRRGVNVIETDTNVGKAGALEEGIRRFGLVKQFSAVLLLDADTRLDPGYFRAALPLFDDPKVVAVAGCAHSNWRTSGLSHVGRLLTAHRSRIYALTQRLLKYGQTWRRTNATHIVPGFA